MPEAYTEYEVWRAYPFAKGYEVSTFGRVRSYWSNCSSGAFIREKWKILKPWTANRGYFMLAVKGPERRLFLCVSRMVLETFVSASPGPHYQCCHNNGNHTDNRLSNLRWDTCKGNNADKNLHGTMSKGEDRWNSLLTESKVREIWRLYSGRINMTQISKRLNVHRTTVSDVINRRTWKHIAVEGSVACI